MHLILCLLILIYFFIIAFLTPDLHPLTRLFPLFVIALALPIGIIETLSVVNQKLNDFLSGTELIGKKSIEEKEADVELSSQAKALGWMMSYVVLFFLIGPLLAMAIAPLVLMRYIGKMKWHTALIVMSITWVVVYLVFGVLVGATLPKGLIFGSIW
jgi:peptidoglycan/LPS O-acetylase OafA/YrhL